ncbi:hypothetical protein C5B99_00245 [Pseudoclavibacter sp. Z016]|nr:hypothetical protein C5B99_00245 [Pseudoclavibacter sp. Z016]
MRVKKAIDQTGRSRRFVAEQVGIPYSTINRKLAFGAHFGLRELLLLAEALGISPSQFMTDDDPVSPMLTPHHSGAGRSPTG